MLEDNGILSGINLVEQCVQIVEQFGFKAEVLAASLRNPRQVREAALVGVHIATLPFTVLENMLKHQRHNDRLLLERNDGYFAGKAHVKGISYRIIPEDLTAVTEFELGNHDIISIPASEYLRFHSSEEWKNLISSQGGINTDYLGFNCARPPFDDPRARKAISHAIDRKKILETYYENRGVLAHGPVSDALRAWSPPEPLSYDPESAIKLIPQAGLQDRTIRFYVPADQEVTDIAEIDSSLPLGHGCHPHRSCSYSHFRLSPDEWQRTCRLNGCNIVGISGDSQNETVT